MVGDGAGGGELHFLDEPADHQTAFDPDTQTFTPSSGAWTRIDGPEGYPVQAVAAGQNGKLYAMAENRRYQVDPATLRWEKLPQAPPRYWARTPDGNFEQRTLDDETRNWGGMTCDPLGNLFLNRQVDGISTLFKFIPGPTVAKGHYQMLAPVRAAGGENDQLAYDYSGVLYTRVAKEGEADRVLYSESASLARGRRFATLPEAPTALGTVDAVGGGGRYDLSSMRYVPLYSE